MYKLALRKTVAVGLVAGALAATLTPAAAANGNGFLGPTAIGANPNLHAQLLLDPHVLGHQFVIPPRPLPTLPTCPDPAVVDFTISDVSSHIVAGWPRYDFRLTATVRNVGLAAYASGHNQQSVVITRKPIGGAPVSIGSGNFPNLAAGAERTVTSSVQTNWSLGAEFPPNFDVRITYDPDIRLDGNPHNDECSSRNNVMKLNGTQVLNLLRGYTS